LFIVAAAACAHAGPPSASTSDAARSPTQKAATAKAQAAAARARAAKQWPAFGENHIFNTVVDIPRAETFTRTFLYREGEPVTVTVELKNTYTKSPDTNVYTHLMYLTVEHGGTVRKALGIDKANTQWKLAWSDGKLELRGPASRDKDAVFSGLASVELPGE
jgi:hypothetical protein